LTVHQVVLHRDIRASVDLSPSVLLNRYHLRRFLSVLCLACFDLGSVTMAALCATRLGRPLDQTRSHPAVLHLAYWCLVVLAAFLVNGLYDRRFVRHDARRLARATVAAMAIVVVTELALGGGRACATAALAILLAAGLAWGARAAYDQLLGRIYDDDGRRPIVLLGRPDSCVRVMSQLSGLAEFRDCRVCGAITDRTVPDDWQRLTGLEALGRVDDLEAVVDREQPVELVVCDLDLTRDRLVGLLAACRRRHVDLELAAIETDLSSQGITLVPGGVTPLFVAAPPKRALLSSFAAKRCFDLAGSALLAVLLLPFMVVVAMLVKLTSRGPVLFVDERIGLGQRTFACYKFRTMYRDAAARQAELEPLNEAGGTIFKIRHDPRVTPIGKVLRRTSLDELPQLLNVLKGDMSLVGPRPLPLRDFRRMPDAHKRRHVVLPGITGLWQVSGRSELSFDDMVALDCRYIESWSFTADLAILARTVGAVCGLRGAS